jgi:peptide chain release factor 1
MPSSSCGISLRHICAVWSGGSFEVQILEETPGFASFLIRGEGAQEFFNETGGHRWQRIPPTERKGRAHTSTVTVAVLVMRQTSTHLNPCDVEIETTRGSGPGGQHRNTTNSCVLAKHLPTGLTVRIDGRSQVQNRRLALEILATRLEDRAQHQDRAKVNQDRKGQVGSGQRGDKVRTYRVRDNMVTDHRTGQRWVLDKWLNGVWE